MAGLSFGNNQGQSRGSGLWWIPIVLIVISIALITLCVRLDGGGPFAGARDAVHAVSKPLESVASGVSGPISSISNASKDDQVAQLEQENGQLKTLVAELEEYRQQDQRLTTLTQLSDAYGLETISAEVTDVTTGWNRTSTINKGSNDGIKVGMGVISSCGLYGQVESVTATTSTVRLVNDANSSVSAMVQSSRARGILTGAYDGTLTLSYVSVGKTVGEGDVVISSGQGGAYPRGIVIGTVSNIETDSSKLYYRITVDPIYSIDACEEVMVLTGNESTTSTILNKSKLDEILSSSATATAQQNATASASGSAAAQPASSSSASASSSDSSSSSSSSSALSSSSSSSASSSSRSSRSSSTSSSSSSGLTEGERQAAAAAAQESEDSGDSDE